MFKILVTHRVTWMEFVLKEYYDLQGLCLKFFFGKLNKYNEYDTVVPADEAYRIIDALEGCGFNENFSFELVPVEFIG